MIKNKLKNFILVLAASVTFASPALAVVPVSAQISEESKTATCEGLGSAGSSCNQSGANNTVTDIISTAINILSLVVGVAAVIMIIIGGFKYVTSNGDSNALSSAKKTIIYTLVGLVIAAMAQGLVRFVLNRADANRAARIQECRDSLPRSEWGTCN